MTTKATKTKTAPKTKTTPKKLTLAEKKKHDDFLTDLALRIHKHEIFTSWHIRDSDLNSGNMLGMVFMPLLLMDDKTRKDFAKRKPFMFYAEYKDQLGSRGINGYPMFGSVASLNKEDAERVWKMMAKLEELDKTAKETALKAIAKM